MFIVGLLPIALFSSLYFVDGRTYIESCLGAVIIQLQLILGSLNRA
jgi:hypothetical protein